MNFVNLSTSALGRATVSTSERVDMGPTFLSILVSEVEGELEETIYEHWQGSLFKIGL